MTSLLLPLVASFGSYLPTHNVLHERTFGKQTNDINRAVLAAVDRIQATAPDGGGYFASDMAGFANARTDDAALGSKNGFDGSWELIVETRCERLKRVDLKGQYASGDGDIGLGGRGLGHGC